MFPVQKIKANSHHNGKPWAYPPLPPNHTVALKKVSFSNATLNFANGDESSSFNYFQNSNSRVKRIINKYDANEYDHESSDCESICMNDTEFEEKFEKKFIDAAEQVNVETTEGRMRGGCGGGCSCAGDEPPSQPQRSYRKSAPLQDVMDREQNCAPQVVSRSQSPSGSSCCPTVGTRPTCAKQSRCDSPCRSDGPGCGGGGCCGGSGCRGGCGKPGQSCRPVRTCGGSTFYRDHSFASRSHWSLAKSDSPHPVSARTHSRTQTGCGRSDTSVNEQLRSPKNEDYDDDDSKQLIRSKSGCECLGGGLDCQRCGRKVYQAEMMIAAGSPYHTICFSCYCCRKPLEPLTYQENCGEIYCKQCLIRNFGPQGYGYGVGAGVLQTPI